MNINQPSSRTLNQLSTFSSTSTIPLNFPLIINSSFQLLATFFDSIPLSLRGLVVIPSVVSTYNISPQSTGLLILLTQSPPTTHNLSDNYDNFFNLPIYLIMISILCSSSKIYRHMQHGTGHQHQYLHLLCRPPYHYNNFITTPVFNFILQFEIPTLLTTAFLLGPTKPTRSVRNNTNYLPSVYRIAQQLSVSSLTKDNMVATDANPQPLPHLIFNALDVNYPNHSTTSLDLVPILHRPPSGPKSLIKLNSTSTNTLVDLPNIAFYPPHFN
jgi:hypothetical protein